MCKMGIIVQKFGGSSVANVDRIKHCAQIIASECKKGNKVAVVVSPLSGVSDQVLELSSEISNLDTKEQVAEFDSIVATGEQVSSGMLALALQKLGLKSRSFTSWQINFRTDSNHAKAKIDKIPPYILEKSIAEGYVPIIAGFQGVTEENRISTLGRGGSDTSAVALAISLEADRCDIYTDVDGVYTTDPRIVKKARKLDKVSYEEMLEMASLGAKVLHTRSVELAMKYHMPLRVVSSFTNRDGTDIVDEDKIMEKRTITGLTYNRNDARVTLKNIEDKPGISAKIFGPLAKANINVDMIVQGAADEADERNLVDLTFTTPKLDIKTVKKILEQNHELINYEFLTIDENVSKISIIGVGMRSESGVASEMFETLAKKGINIKVISTSEIKISVLIDEEYTELALRTLHHEYDLDEQEE